MTVSPFGFDNPRPGMVVMWDEPISEIPVGWAICDGNNGTIDMFGKFPMGAIDDMSVGVEGGSASVTLTASNLPSHTHPNSSTGHTGDHNHNISYNENDVEPDGYGKLAGGPGNDGHTSRDGDHSHNISSVGSTGGDGAIDNNPSYYEVIFIQKL